MSINDFTSEDIQKAQKWAYKFYNELGTKSPFFRSWFGEWRLHDTISKKTKIVVPTIDISNAVLENGDYYVNDTKWVVHAGSTLNDDTRHHSGGNRINVKSLTAIKDILNNSVLLDTVVSEKDKGKKSVNTEFLHKLYSAIEYGGKEYIAVVTVEELFDESKNEDALRAYNLKAIKIEPSGGREGTSPTTPNVGLGSEYTIADLYAFVNTLDKEFHAGKEVSPYLLNKNGTPKKVYHGTNADFTVFEKGDIGYHVGSRAQAEDRIGGGDGGHIMELYAAIRHPLEVGMDYGDWHGKYAASMMLETEQFEGYENESYIVNRLEEISEMEEEEADKALPKLLKELGYDGIMYENSFEGDAYREGNVSFIAFDANQLKSASDNIGTFDKGNDDIRYSRTISDEEASSLRKENTDLKRKLKEAEKRAEKWKNETAETCAKHGNILPEKRKKGTRLRPLFGSFGFFSAFRNYASFAFFVACAIFLCAMTSL